MKKDLRSYLSDLGDLLLRVSKEVDPERTMGELSAQSTRPILFTNIKGHPGWRVCDVLLRSRETQARLLGTTPDKVVPHLAEMLERPPVPAKVVDSGKCQEEVLVGDQVDLTKLPILIHSEGDAGRYIGSGVNITKDPETGIRNLACLRMQIKGPKVTGLHMSPRHTWMHVEKWEARGEGMPMAVAIGVHPLIEIATNYCTTYGVDEFAIAGALMGEPVELVKCKTIDVEVPAAAEIVLEGRVRPNVRELEGPFGEFQGAYGPRAMKLVYDVTAITMRRQAIYRHIQANTSDHHALITLPMEARLFRELRDVEGYIDLKDVHVPGWGGCWLTIVKMTPHYEGQVKDVLLGAMSSSYHHPKIIIAVDEDVDIYRAEDVMWAMATRVNPARDVIVIDGTRNHTLDISLPEIVPPGGRWQRVGSKMGIDATKPSTSFPEKREVFRRVRPMGRGQVRLEDFLG